MKHAHSLNDNYKATIEKWREELECDDIGKRIVKNFRNEPNLDKKEFLSFYERVCEKYPDRASLNLDAKSIIEYCADHEYENPHKKPLTFRGPKIDRNNDEKLYRLESANKFLQPFLEKSHMPYGPSHAPYEYFLSKIKQKKLDKDDLKGKFIGNKRGIVWCTWEKSVKEAEKDKNTLDDLRDRLGLSHFYEGMETIQLVYDQKVINGLEKGLRCPTIMDAGSNPYFLPGGRAMSLSSKEGLPEMIHEKIPMDSIDIKCRGKLTR